MILDLLKDDCANCYSLMVQMTINEYLDKIQSSFEKKGGLEGQRETIKTKTAQKIRERMIEDLHLLNELTTKNAGTTRTRGYKQREFYKEAFSKLIKLDFEVPSMTVC